MRAVLIGPPGRRLQLRRQLPAEIEIIGESPTLAAARPLASQADAYIVVPPEPAEERLVEHLTPRETEVLMLVAEGLSNRKIAERLAISEETVKFHLAAIFGKLAASNRTDAVRQALRRGLIPL